MLPFTRYPGSKSKHTAKILRHFSPDEKDYREPFVGGGSVFLASRFNSAWINDLDPGIYDLWRMVKECPDILIGLIRKHTDILDHKKIPKKIDAAINLWKKIRDDEGDFSEFPIGYRALFLNRTCFSGVKTGGPVGGYHQNGEYNLSSRWSPMTTIKRIQMAHGKLKNVRITNLSYEELLNNLNDDTCFYFDPTYLEKGSQCYDYYFSLEDHIKFAEQISRMNHRYIITLDDCETLRGIWEKLVPNHLITSHQWLYSMSDYRDENKTGKEMFICDQKSFDTYVSKSKSKKSMIEYR